QPARVDEVRVGEAAASAHLAATVAFPDLDPAEAIAEQPLSDAPEVVAPLHAVDRAVPFGAEVACRQRDLQHPAGSDQGGVSEALTAGHHAGPVDLEDFDEPAAVVVEASGN